MAKKLKPNAPMGKAPKKTVTKVVTKRHSEVKVPAIKGQK